MARSHPGHPFRGIPSMVILLGTLFCHYEHAIRVLPSLMMRELLSSYHLSYLSLGCLLAVYYAVTVSVQFLALLFVDFISIKRWLTSALLMCAVGACMFAYAETLWLAILARCIVSAGTSFAFIALIKLVCAYFPRKQFIYATGVVLALGILGSVLADVMLSIIMTLVGWRLVCYLVAFIAALFALIYFVCLRNNRSVPWQRKSFSKVKCLAGIRGVLALLRYRKFWMNCLLGLLLYLPVAGFAESWGVRFFVLSDQLPRSLASLSTGMIFLGFACGAPLVGWICDNFKLHQLLVSFGAVGSMIVLCILLYVPDLSFQRIVLFSFVLGFFASVQMVVFAIARDIAPEKMVVTALVLTNMITLAAGVFVCLIGMVLSAKIDFRWSLSILPLGLLGAVFLGFYVRDVYRPMPLRSKISVSKRAANFT